MCVCLCVYECGRMTLSSVLDLLKELVGGVLVAILLHLGQMALFWGDSSIHLLGSQEQERREVKKSSILRPLSGVDFLQEKFLKIKKQGHHVFIIKQLMKVLKW